MTDRTFFLRILIVFLIIVLHRVALADLENYPEPAEQNDFSHLQSFLNELASDNPYQGYQEHRKQPDYVYEDVETVPIEDFHFYPAPPQIFMNKSKKPFAVTPFQPEFFEEYKTNDRVKSKYKNERNKETLLPGMIMFHENQDIVFEEPRQQRQNPNLAATKINKLSSLDSPSSPMNRKFTSERDIPTSLVPTSSRHQHVIQQAINNTSQDYHDIHIYIQAAMLGTGAAAILVVLSLGIYTLILLRKHSKDAADVEYPAYGVTGPNTDLTPSGDRRLAQSAQMYHYQHQKQQIIAMENSRTGVAERNGSVSDAESEDENEEGDYTVYECPGFASTGEMEVKNPLFSDEPTPATPATKK